MLKLWFHVTYNFNRKILNSTLKQLINYENNINKIKRNIIKSKREIKESKQEVEKLKIEITLMQINKKKNKKL